MHYDDSVHEIFNEDLRHIRSGYCFLPEWICSSMSDVAIDSKHETVFYPVNSMLQAHIPLEADWDKLLSMIDSLIAANKPIIILLAFPLGYVDYRLFGFREKVRRYTNNEFFLFLDLAQAYGMYDFSKVLHDYSGLYISFNRNKLINKGGGVKITPEDCGSSKLDNLCKEINVAIEHQMNDWHHCLLGLKKLLPETYSWESKLNKYNHVALRSSFHRTIILEDSLSQNAKIIVKRGYGQLLKKQPQQQQPSAAYLEWQRSVVSLFPKVREV